MEKIDLHIHCAPKRQELGRENPRDPLDCYIADAQELQEHLRGQGIKKAVLMSGGETQRDGAFTGNNDCCRDIVRAAPDFFAWMCNVDAESPQTLRKRLALYQQQGAVGVGEVSVNEWMDSPFLTALFAAAEELSMPITFHMSPEPGFSYGVCDRQGLPLLEQALQRFPRLKLLGHSQVFWLEISGDCPQSGNQERSAMGRGQVKQGGRVPELMRKYPNLYGDLSAYSGSCAILRDESQGLAFLEEFSDRLFFATDTVNRRQTFPLAKFLDECREAGRLSELAWENICNRNAQRVFGL